MNEQDKKLADYAVVFELVGRITSYESEEAAIDNIMDLFRNLCAPSRIIYISMVDGRYSEIRTFPEKINPEAVVSDLINNFKDDYAWTTSGAGFRLKIRGREGVLGLIEVEGVLFPDHKSHYLNLSLTIASALSLAISNSRVYQSLLHVNKKLGQLNIHLEEQVGNKINEIRHKEQMLIQQSKMASMGEMIGLIAHQWKQPLNSVGLTIQDLKDAYNYGEIDDKFIDNIVDSTMKQVEFMSKTIDDFRNFFVPSKKKTVFNVKSAIEELLSMFIHLFNKVHIDVFVKTDKDVLLLTEGYPNEFKQVALNIMTNSRDAIVSKRKVDTEKRGLIEISVSNNENKSKVIISIRDNGGGIPEDLIMKIFEPYFTTKENEGTGIGLYMSKTIIETNMGGSLTVHNIDGGAEFVISLNGDTI
ncbi:MAG: HAMP domain-containing histidine kinase [Nitrospirae bacterium]|nr:HAMP domain-containing histidine kinase [Nitrospirota bacterium]